MTVEVRPLQKNDFAQGFFELLGELSSAPTIDRANFDRLVDRLEASPSQRVVVAVEARDGAGNCLLGTASLLLEQKFIRGAGVAGHIEDVVVHSGARGRGVGKLMVDELVQWAKAKGCYKVILDCAEENVVFYEKCGFRKKEVQMAMYLSD